LKYVVIANMLTANTTNPFNWREAKVLENDPEIAAVVQLQRAYDNSDVKAFQRVLKTHERYLMKDSFIVKYIDPLLRQTRSQTILTLIKPYKRIRLESLGAVLNVDVGEVESLLVRLILDNKVSGRIDQVNQMLDIGEARTEKKYLNMQRWSQALGRMNSTLVASVSSSRDIRGMA